jgi:hypothetical protein
VARTTGTVRRALEQLAERGVIYTGDDERWNPMGEFFHRTGHDS